MTLFLHIGTEKTGSSFLQVVLARNRSWLLDHGIYFPHAGKWEKEMHAGRISPGNGEMLQRALKNGDHKRTESLLKSYREEALQKGAVHVLVSNELLFLGMSSGISGIDLDQMAKSLGYSEVRCLLFLRDPVDQTLSLYRHRAKSGQHGHLKEWLKSGYELPELLQQFVTRAPQNLMVRKYDSSGEVLMKRFFSDWLRISPPELKDLEQRVNPSLSLSELRMIVAIRQIQPQWVRPFYQTMLSIPSEEKAADEGLKKLYLLEIQQQVIKAKNIWEIYNKMLPVGEQLHIEEISLMRTSQEHLSFSVYQIEAIAVFMLKATTLTFKIKLTTNSVRNVLGQIKLGIYNRFRLG